MLWLDKHHFLPGYIDIAEVIFILYESTET